MPRNWTLEHTQAEGVYGLSLHVHDGLWRHGRYPTPFRLSAGVEVTGSLEQFERLARALLDDVAAIRAEEGKT